MVGNTPPRLPLALALPASGSPLSECGLRPRSLAHPSERVRDCARSPCRRHKPQGVIIMRLVQMRALAEKQNAGSEEERARTHENE